MRMSSYQLQVSTRGKWYGMPPSEMPSLSTDTRSLKAGEAFLALRGVSFDGHRFASAAMQRGASMLIGDAAGNAQWKSVELPVLEVNDTLKALGDIAGAWRKELSATVIAIAGSYGKTTLRSMLAYALGRMGLNVAATKANDNNLIGVPQTLLSIDKDVDVALVECGISEVGEMQRLGKMVQPDMVIITGFSPAHAEGLGDLRGVVYEKGRLLHHLTRKGCAVSGSGVFNLMREYGILPDVSLMDMDDPTDKSVVHWQIQGRCCLLQLGGVTAAVDLNLPAQHQAAGMALAATVIHQLTQQGIVEIAAALAAWQAVPGRMQCLSGIHDSIIIHDAYNANPASMRAALDTVRGMSGRHFAVLGDMAELGKESSRLHAALDVSGLDGIVLVGQQMQALTDVCEEVQWVPTTDAALLAVGDWMLHANDVVLVKGSRCMALEKVVSLLTQQGKADAV